MGESGHGLIWSLSDYPPCFSDTTMIVIFQMDNFVTKQHVVYMRVCAEAVTTIRQGNLTVLGASGDGKTSVVDRLVGRKFNPKHLSTVGIDATLTCDVNTINCTQAWVECQEDKADSIGDIITQVVGEKMFQQCTEEDIQSSNVCCNTPGRGQEDTSVENLDPEAETRLKIISLYTTLDQIREEKQEKTSIRILDFAGQSVYQTIHHAFIRTESVCILVINLRIDLESLVPISTFQNSDGRIATSLFEILGLGMPKGQKSVKYVDQIFIWLNTIISHLQGDLRGKVILVGTHKDKLAWSVAKQEKMAASYFDRLKGLLVNKAHKEMIHEDCFAVDNKGGDTKTYAKLRPAILELVKKHCPWNVEQPVKWLQMEKHLHALSGNGETAETLDNQLLRFEEVCEIGKKYKIKSDEMVEFLKFHHATGNITYLCTEELKQYVISNPQWLVDIFKAVITIPLNRPKDPDLQADVKRLDTCGILNIGGPFLKHVWQKFLLGRPDESQRVKFMVDLLIYFDLICQFEGELYLVPSLLPWSPSKQDQFKEYHAVADALYLRFHASKTSINDSRYGSETYDQFLPFAFFQRLICRMVRQPGWKLSTNKYQDEVSYYHADHLVVLKNPFQSTWISLEVLEKTAITGSLEQDLYDGIFQTLSRQISCIMTAYHPNMWFEVCVNPCQGKVIDQVDGCLAGIGVTSEDLKASPHTAECKVHKSTLPPSEVKKWFTGPRKRVAGYNGQPRLLDSLLGKTELSRDAGGVSKI